MINISNEPNDKITHEEFKYIAEQIPRYPVYYKLISFSDCKVVIYGWDNIIEYDLDTPEWVWAYLESLDKNKYYMRVLWNFGTPIPDIRGFKYYLQGNDGYYIHNDTIVILSDSLHNRHVSWDTRVDIVERWMMEFGDRAKVLFVPEWLWTIPDSESRNWKRFIARFRDRGLKFVCRELPPDLNQPQYQNLFYLSAPYIELKYPLSHYKGVYVDHTFVKYENGKLIMRGGFPKPEILNNCPNRALVDGEEKLFDKIVVKSKSSVEALKEYKQALLSFDYHIIYEMIDQNGLTLSWASLVHKPKFSDPRLEKWYNEEDIEDFIRMNKKKCEQKALGIQANLGLMELPSNIVDRVRQLLGE